MFMSTKKLRVFALASVSVLVIAFAFVTIGFTSSAALATPSRNSNTPPIPPIIREVYKVTAGGGDATAVNIRDGNCNIIGSVKINTIVTIRGASDSNAIICPATDGNPIKLYRLSEDQERKNGRYIAENNLAKRNAGEAFNNEGKALVSSSKGLRIRGADCKLLNETDKSIPKALSNNTLVTLSEPVETITCDIVDPIPYTFEMVKVVYEYTKGGQNVKVTGYVAQEFLRPAKIK
jgi:hypothetical protein